MKERIDRQAYYREMLGFLLEKYFEMELDPAKNFEVLMPEDRIDIFFSLEKSVLKRANKRSPFPYFMELNLVHVKAYHDPLQKRHVLQYLHQLYGQASAEKNKNKSIMLLILVANEPAKGIFEGSEHQKEKTEHEFIDKIKAEYPAYLLVLERLPVEEKNWYFVPFFPLEKLEREKEEVLELAKSLVKKMGSIPEYKYFLVWLRILQREYYQKYLKMEVEMALGEPTKQILVDLFPTLTKRIEEDAKIEGKIEGKIEELLNILSWTAPEIGKKYGEEIKGTKTEDELKKLENKIKKELMKKR
jgi:hypothetical protein